MATAKKKTTSKNTKKAPRKTTKKVTNKERQMRAANRRMISFFVILILIIFALARLGPFGLFLYNLVRFAVGSLAITALVLGAVFLILSRFKKEIFKENKRIISAILVLSVAVMLLFQVAFDKQYGNQTALHFLWNELLHGRVSHFAGAGVIGSALFAPAKSLFSVIGVYFIVVLLILIALYLFAPGLLPKVHANLKEKMNQKLAEMKENRAEKAKAKREAQVLAQINQPEETAEVADLAQTNAIEKPARPEIPIAISQPENAKPAPVENAPTDEAINFAPAAYQGNYQLPTIDLLAEIPVKNQSAEKENVRKNIHILEETFQSFGIAATVESAVVGPSVTKYEIKLATGVKVSRVVNLSDDLALALAAQDVRIEAPIPGKSLVGVEIPNAEVATVGFREMWENSKTNPQKLLEIPLGKSLDGGMRIFDLTRMPHLLIAGSTGSGKSVAVNGIITSILMKALPSQVKFLMVDPKMVELSVYNDIPHLLIPVVTNPRKAARALQKVVDEMENRYELFSKYGVRNINGYNEKIVKYNATSNEKMLELPLIVVIVDELADLMMVASKEVEDAIIRLGQKARAAGIHMILATQRPSVDVISGLIKANVPSRVAFAVSSGTDSRTIIDQNGAEKLLGRGDMLFKPIDENHPVRLQGAFLSDDDVESVVDFIKNQSEAQYDLENFDPGEVSEDDGRGNFSSDGASGDPLFEDAKMLVISAQKASTAQLQRTLKVGFNRASDLMNELEAAGVVGPAKGTTPRKVLITQDGEILEGEE